MAEDQTCPAEDLHGHELVQLDGLQDHLSSSHPSLMTVSDESSDLTPLDVFCVTLYNESWSDLRETIVSVVVASERARDNGAGRYAICVIADGATRMSPSTRSGLEQSHLLIPDPLRYQHLEVHISEHRASALLTRFGIPMDATMPDGFMHLIVCVKDENRGKLDSHRVFFELICDSLSPRLCYQLDAGSTFEPDAIGLLLQKFEAEPQVAGIAPRVTPAIPRPAASALESWQYYDFAYRQAVLLPVESALDLLGVMPGQACAFRWSALRHKRTSASRVDPISAYLYGIASSSPLRPLLYLSEDRVIGGAILLDPIGDWRLRFVPESVAFTDACGRFSELLRQRRRWTNSALLCRLWLSTKWRQLLELENRSAAVKARQFLSIAFEFLVGFLEFTAPAQLVAFALVLGKIASASAQGGVLVGALLACMLFEIALRGVSRIGRQHWIARASNLAALGASWACVILLVATLFVCLPGVSSSLVLGALLLPLGCMACLLPIRSLPTLIRMRLSPILSTSIFCATLGYSLWNMRDTSWGTRGLVAHTRSPATRRSLGNFRWYVLASWLLVNGLVVSAALSPGISSVYLNPIVETASVLELAFAGAAFLWLLVRRAERKLSKGFGKRSGE